MPSIRFLDQVPQGEGEAIYYTLTTTNWGASPTDIAVTVMDLTDNEDVSSTVLAGDASVDGNVITLPQLSGLTAGHSYRVNVAFTAGGNDLVAWFRVVGEL